MRKTQQQGFTLIELIITLLVLGVLASLALPAMGDFLEKRRLIGAAEDTYNHIVFARSEAIKQSRSMRVSMDDDEWCLGTRSGTGTCDCTIGDITDADACVIDSDGTNVLTRVNGDGYPGITMTNTFTGDTMTFDGVRGLPAGGFGTVTMTSPTGWEIQVNTNILGRVRMCSPAGAANVAGYPEC